MDMKIAAAAARVAYAASELMADIAMCRESLAKYKDDPVWGKRTTSVSLIDFDVVIGPEELFSIGHGAIDRCEAACRDALRDLAKAGFVGVEAYCKSKPRHGPDGSALSTARLELALRDLATSMTLDAPVQPTVGTKHDQVQGFGVPDITTNRPIT